MHVWEEEVPRPETRFLSRETEVSHNISALTAATTYTHMKKMYANRARFPQGIESTKVPKGMHIPCFPKRKKQILTLWKGCQMTTPPTESMHMKEEDNEEKMKKKY